MAEGSSERSRMYRGRDVELQELGTEEDINCSGEKDLLDLPFMGVRTFKGDRQCRQRPRQYASTAVDNMPGTSMVREDKLQSQKRMEEIGTGNLTMWFREEFEKVNSQMIAEKDEWAMSRVNGGTA